MIQSYFKYLFATSANVQIIKYRHFFHKLAKAYPFRGRGFHTPVEWTVGYKEINNQVTTHNLIVNTAFYIYGNIILKQISILNSFEQIQENTISGSVFSARLDSSAVAFIPDPVTVRIVASSSRNIQGR